MGLFKILSFEYVDKQNVIANIPDLKGCISFPNSVIIMHDYVSFDDVQYKLEKISLINAQLDSTQGSERAMNSLLSAIADSNMKDSLKTIVYVESKISQEQITDLLKQHKLEHIKPVSIDYVEME